MKILKHDAGFIKIESIGSFYIDSYAGGEAGRWRAIVKVDGENAALFARSEEAMKRKVDKIIDIMLEPNNKGIGIYIWEDL